MPASSLRRWWLRRRHGGGEWDALLQPPPANEWVSLDLETTGLDPRKDHILSLAAVPVRDSRIVLSDRFERLVRPRREFGIESIRHHLITPGEAAAGVHVEEAVGDFLRWLGSRTLLGYYLGFDLAMLAPHVKTLTGFPLPNRCIDLAEEVAARERRARPDAPADLTFTHIAASLGVPVLGRHTALGDATTTALCWLALQPRPQRT